MPTTFQGQTYSQAALITHLRARIAVMPSRNDLAGEDLLIVQELWARVNEGKPPARAQVVPGRAAAQVCLTG